MVELQLITLASIGVISLICQWFAWRLRLPAILFLLMAGIFLGPYLGFLNPSLFYLNYLIRKFTN